MCTSFVVHTEKTFIGMNFDISKRPIKIVLLGESQFLVLQNDNGKFLPAFGLNSSGTFMNLLMVAPNEEGMYKRGKYCVHIMRLFEDILAERMELSMLETFLNDHTVVNVPNHSVHSLVAGKNRNTYIVEPGRKIMDTNEKDFKVLTNFSLADHLDHEYREVNGPGDDRYIKAYETIVKHKNKFNKEIGFSLLAETAQYEGEYPTQFSMISVPEENKVYFALNRNFNKIFQFSFIDKQIQTCTSFETSKSMALSKKGILLSELECW